MTEGPVVRGIPSDKANASRVSDEGVVPVGWAGAGHAFRVADPESNEVVPLCELGELQASGPAIAHYLGDAGQSGFYIDSKGRRWLKTGDQAKINKEGCIFITGRYKDMCVSRKALNIHGNDVEGLLTLNNPGSFVAARTFLQQLSRLLYAEIQSLHDLIPKLLECRIR